MKMVEKRAKLSDQSIYQYIIMGQSDTKHVNALSANNYNNIMDLISHIKQYESIWQYMQSTSNPSLPINNRAQPYQCANTDESVRRSSATGNYRTFISCYTFLTTFNYNNT